MSSECEPTRVGNYYTIAKCERELGVSQVSKVKVFQYDSGTVRIIASKHGNTCKTNKMMRLSQSRTLSTTIERKTDTKR